MSENSDIRENEILSLGSDILDVLLLDRTRTTADTVHNILWCTEGYEQFNDEAAGLSYRPQDEMTAASVTGERGLVLRPRVNKSLAEQRMRTSEKAEVFTPAWICNAQNNLVDAAWCGLETAPFNRELDKTWETITGPVPFPTPSGRTWQDYVRDTRLEMTCGEAPYLVSRYNAVTGEDIPVRERIGLLDRKLRVVRENTTDFRSWMRWATEAYKATYGFEWQGDSLMLAREALLYTFIDNCRDAWDRKPTREQLLRIAEIISWNLWQMDGLKCVIPGSCYDKRTEEYTLFGDVIEHVEPCEGCEKDEIRKHNGIYCRIMDWETGKPVRFVDLLKG